MTVQQMWQEPVIKAGVGNGVSYNFIGGQTTKIFLVSIISWRSFQDQRHIGHERGFCHCRISQEVLPQHLFYVSCFPLQMQNLLVLTSYAFPF